jgi:hypothetical protein
MSTTFYKLTSFLTLAAVLATSQGTSAAVINEFLPIAGPTTPGEWYLADVRPGGTATIENLTGLGGNLETNQPLPTGAAKLTTINDNTAKAEVYTYDNFGPAATFLSSASVGYDYYKADSGLISPLVAPAMKIQIFAPGGTGDNFGALVWEPYWNGAVTPDVWTNVAITSATGGGDGDSTGGWWWNGGFNIPNGAGGPPLRSLAEWATAFAAADPADFATANVVGIGMGIGTFNPAQTNYFDNVSYSHLLNGETWDFQAAVPEPTSIVLLGLATGSLFVVRRRRRRG